MIADPINPNRPLTALWKRIEEAVRFSNAAGPPMTGSQVLNILITVLTQTEIYSSDIKKWKAKPVPLQTYARIKTFSNAAFTRNLHEKRVGGNFGAPLHHKPDDTTSEPMCTVVERRCATFCF